MGTDKASALSCVKILFVSHHDPFLKKVKMGVVYLARG
jgi:hypothetical protein